MGDYREVAEGRGSEGEGKVICPICKKEVEKRCDLDGPPTLYYKGSPVIVCENAPGGLASVKIKIRDDGPTFVVTTAQELKAELMKFEEEK